MMTAYDFTVTGRPAPQGSKRHVGHGVLVESSKYVLPWRAAVVAAAVAARARQDGAQITEPCSVYLIFTLKKPARPKWEMHGTQPDLDKLIRATLDGITESGIWADDGLAWRIWAQKQYPQDVDNVGCRVCIGP